MEDIITPTAEELELLKSLRSTGYDPNASRNFGDPPMPNPISVTPTRVPSAADMASKRLSTLQAVGRDHYLAGVQKPKTSPMGAASSDQAQKRYEAAMADKTTLQRRQSALKTVSDSTWAAMIEAVGADRLVPGAVAKAYKYEQFAAKYEGALKTILAQADTMDTTTLEGRLAKSAFVIRELAKLKGKV